MDIDKIINIVRNLREQAVMGAPTNAVGTGQICLLYTSPSPRDPNRSRMPSSA